MQAQMQSSAASQDSHGDTSQPARPLQSDGEALSPEVHGPDLPTSDEICDHQRLNNLLMALLLYPGCWRAPGEQH